jgi:H/ACA ribonucleoprotein complex subunit 4
MVTEIVHRKKEQEGDYTIKPQAVTPTVDTSQWPLLLKNYEKRK